MPWKDLKVSKQRREFVNEAMAKRRDVTEVCAAYGISRVTGHKWISRFEEGGAPGLENQSRAPHHRPHAMSSEQQKRLLETKSQYPLWGPRKIRAAILLKAPDLALPSPTAIYHLFAQHGLVKKRGRRRARPVEYNAANGGYAGPNALWCTDFKGDMDTPKGRIAPFTCTDGSSRYLLKAAILRRNNERCTRQAFDALFSEFGLPDAIRSDNGVPFSSTGLAGLSTLSVWWIRLGITPVLGRPGCPQDNGRHERMHGSLEYELADELRVAQHPTECLAAFQRRFNEERPHEAIANKTPSQVYVASSKVYPRRLADPVYPQDLFVERADKHGAIHWIGHRHMLSPLLAGQLIAIGIDEPSASAILRFGPVALGRIRNLTRTAAHPHRKPYFDPGE